MLINTLHHCIKTLKFQNIFLYLEVKPKKENRVFQFKIKSKLQF